MNRKSGCFRRTDSVAFGQKGSARMPGAFEHSGHDEHGHVAAHAIALAGDSLQLADHCLLQFRVGIVELQRVGPTVKVRVSAVGEQQRPVFRFHPAVILG